jgi:PAS domain-containing protein
MMRSLLPLLSHELKDVLSKFEHAFVVSDATWREFPIIYASAGFFSLTGYSPQEVIGQNWYVGGWVGLQGVLCLATHILPSRFLCALAKS